LALAVQAEQGSLGEISFGARDEFVLAATVQNLKTLALRTLKPPPAQPGVSFA
jgi:hypothetical protein